MTDLPVTSPPDGPPDGPLAGQLTVTVTLAGDRIHTAEVNLVRPPVTHLLLGCPIAVALTRVPRLFSICAVAQAAAAAGAVEAALSAPPAPAVLAARARRVAIEAAENHGWFLAIAWPGSTGGCVDPGPLARLRRLARNAAAAPDDPGSLRALAGQLREMAEAWGPSAQDLAGLPGDPPLAQRAAALQTLCHALETDTPAPAAGGSVLTSRGWLTHRVTLVDGQATTWSIDAPTDRHFAPDGRFLASLRNAAISGDPRRAIATHIVAFDPCVPWRLAFTAGTTGI